MDNWFVFANIDKKTQKPTPLPHFPPSSPKKEVLYTMHGGVAKLLIIWPCGITDSARAVKPHIVGTHGSCVRICHTSTLPSSQNDVSMSDISQILVLPRDKTLIQANIQVNIQSSFHFSIIFREIFIQKKRRKIWSIQKNVITLHLQTERNGAGSCDRKSAKKVARHPIPIPLALTPINCLVV